MKKDLTNEISVGIVEFDGPTLLLIGGTEGLRKLADIFSTGPSTAPVSLDSVFKSDSFKLNLHLNAPQTKLVNAGKQVDWFISSTDGKDYGDLVRAVAEHQTPSHTYIDVPNAGMEIVVSKGEYDPEVVFKH